METSDEKWFQVSKKILEMYKSLNDIVDSLKMTPQCQKPIDGKIVHRAGIKGSLRNESCLKWEDSLRDN